MNVKLWRWPILLTSVVWANLALGQSNPNFLPFQALVTNSSDVPITGTFSGGTALVIEILDHTNQCIVYKEAINTVSTDSKGMLSWPIGVGGAFSTITYATGSPGSIQGILTSPTFNVTGAGCLAGNAQAGTTPTVTLADGRDIQFSIDNGTTWSSASLVSMGSVPYAYNADSLGGVPAANYVTTATPNWVTLTTNVDASSAGLHHHDSRYALLGGSATQNFTAQNETVTNKLLVGGGVAVGDIDIEKGGAVSLRLGTTNHGGNPMTVDFYADNGATPRASIKAMDSASTLSFFTGGAQAMQINANQSVAFSSSMSVGSGLGLWSSPTDAAYSASLTAPNEGTIWENNATRRLRYYDGISTNNIATENNVVNSIGAGTGTTVGGSVTTPTVNVTYGTAANTAMQGNQAFAGDVTGSVGATVVSKLQTYVVDLSTAPTNNQVLTYNTGASKWTAQNVPATASAGGNKQIQYSNGAGAFNASATATDFTWDDAAHKLSLSGTAPTGDAFVVPAAPLGAGGGAANSLVRLGTTDIAGGNTNGTYLAINQGAATADYINFQLAGASKFLVDKNGSVTATGFTGNGANLTNLPAGNITGVLPIANGGTNSSTALNNNRLMISSGGAIVENPAGAVSQTLVSGGPGVAPVWSADLTVDNVNHLVSVDAGAPSGNGFVIPQAPKNSATKSLIKLDATDIAGGNANGTYIGANPGSAVADFINYQVGGTTKFGVDKNGVITGVGTGITGITATPAGASGQVQFNSGGGTMAADGNFSWDNTNKRLGLGNAAPGNQLTMNVPTSNDSLAQAMITTTANTNKGLVLQAKTGGQTANMLEVQSSAGSVLYSIEPTGTPTASTDLITKNFFNTIVPTTLSNYVKRDGTYPMTGNWDVNNVAAAVDVMSFGTPPTASNTSAMVNLSNTALAGASANGTYVGANPNSAVADFINYQVTGTSKFKVDKNGNVTASSFSGAAPVVGATTQIEFNKAGVMSGSTDMTWDDVNHIMILNTTNAPVGNALVINNAPKASATKSLVRLDTIDLVAASANGTYIGANPPSANADFINYQVNGITKFGVDKNGVITGVGTGITGITATPAGASGQVQFNSGIGTMAADNNLSWDNTNKRLGIGTSTPASYLDISATVAGGATDARVFNADTTGAARYIVGASGAGNGALTVEAYGAASIYGNHAAGDARAPGGATLYWSGQNGPLSLAATFGSSYLRFLTGGDLAANERMRITSSGNVGIGNTSPAVKLDVNGVIGLSDGGVKTYFGGLASEQSAQIVDFGINEDGGNRFGGAYTSGTQGGMVRVDTRAGNPLFQFQGRAAGSTVMNQYMSILGNGNIGIGTQTPQSKFQLNSAGFTPLATNGVVSIGAGTFTGAAGDFIGSGSGTMEAINAPSGFGGDLVNYQVNGVSKFSVDKNGKITADGSGLTGVIGSLSGMTSGSVLFAASANTFGQDNANFFWDSTNHRLGIGTPTPTSRLQVPWISGDSAPTAKFGMNTAGNTQDAVWGLSDSGFGIYGSSLSSTGIWGEASGGGAAGVYGKNFNGGPGIVGLSNTGNGVFGMSNSGTSGMFASTTVGNAAPTLVTRQIGASTADLFQAQLSGGTSLFKITSTGSVGIGTTNPSAVLDIQNGSGISGLLNTGFGAPGFGAINLRAARGTQAAPTAVLIGDYLGALGFRGYGATAFSPIARAEIKGIASENWTDTAQGTVFTFSTTPNGTITNTERMRIDQNGNVGIGTPTPQAGLDIATTGTGASAIIVPRDSSLNRPATLVNGMVRYNTTNNIFEFYQNGAWVNYATTVASGYLPLSGGTLTATASITGGDHASFSSPTTNAVQGTYTGGTTGFAGLSGINSATITGTAGVSGINNSNSATTAGVSGSNNSTSSQSAGVNGTSVGPGAGIMGQSSAGSSGYFISSASGNLNTTLVAQQIAGGGADLLGVLDNLGSNLMKVSAAGNMSVKGRLAIGSTTFAPGHDIDLDGSAFRDIFMERTGGGSGNPLQIQAGGATSGSTNQPGGTLFLSSGISTGNAGSGIIFSTYGGGAGGAVDSTPTTAMAIAGKNIGIGTTMPQAPLHVMFNPTVGAPDWTMMPRIDNTFTGGGGNPISGLTITSSFAGNYNWAMLDGIDGAGVLSFRNALTGSDPVASGVTRLSVTSAGNVGIGTPNANSPLEIKSSPGAPTSFLNIHNGNTGGGIAGVYEYLNSDFINPSTRNFAFTTNHDGPGFFSIRQGTAQGADPVSSGNPIFVIDGGGKVGIGTISPNAALDVAGFVETLGQSRVTSVMTVTSSSALSPIPGLSATLVAGKTYAFDIILYTTSNVAGGIKVDLNGGTATASAIVGDGIAIDAAAIQTQSRIAGLATGLCTKTAVTLANCHITGTITVAAPGTFIPRFSQNVPNAASSTVAAGSTMILQQIN